MIIVIPSIVEAEDIDAKEEMAKETANWEDIVSARVHIILTLYYF